MDTRTKIVSAATAAQLHHGTFVRGYFDPLTVAHVRQIEELTGPVTILLDSPPRPLLPVAARAELLAALTAVNQVVISENDVPPEFAAHQVMDERDGDLRRARELMDHVMRRQNAG